MTTPVDPPIPLEDESHEMLRCGPTTSMTYIDLQEFHKKGEVDRIYVHETPVGFYVCVFLYWKPKRIWYLTTQLDRFTPRIFKDLHRLNEYMLKYWPALEYTVRHRQQLPRRSDETVQPRSKKVYRKLAPKDAPRRGEKVEDYEPKI